MRKVLLLLALAGVMRADQISVTILGSGAGTYSITPFDSSLGLLTSVGFSYDVSAGSAYIFMPTALYRNGITDGIGIDELDTVSATLKGTAGQIASYQKSVAVHASRIVNSPGPTTASSTGLVIISQEITANLQAFLSSWSVTIEQTVSQNKLDWGVGAQLIGGGPILSLGGIDVTYTYMPIVAQVPEPRFQLAIASLLGGLLLYRKRLRA